MHRIIAIICLVSLSLLGCKSGSTEGNTSSGAAYLALNDGVKTNSVASSTIAGALIVSLTKVNPDSYGGWDGDCPGTDVDAGVFADMCQTHNVPYVKLENEQASISNVEANAVALAKTISEEAGLLILFFSGHGGQVATADASMESDGLDETICLWDAQLRDKHIWSLLNRLPRRVRVWMVTDCCNSGTNYRKPRNYSAAIRKLAQERHSMRVARGIVERADSQEPNLLHWGGCGDGESSYGSAKGGKFTTALVDTYSPRLTYAEWFNAAIMRMPSYQRPTWGETGVSFKDTLIFR